MVQAGASGYLLKEAGKKELFTAIRTIASGGKYFSSGISNMMIENFIRRAQHPSSASAPPSGAPRLTGRETEVLTHIAEGMTNRSIAEKLFLSVRTINTHRVNLMRKLKIHDTASLVRYAIQEGLVNLKK
jgi:DNA-binding NarL/FixJ family response regulator